MPAILKEAEAVFGRVSVVQMARESSAKERAEARRLRASTGSARRIFSTGSCTPITPVEQTKISCGAKTEAAGGFFDGADAKRDRPAVPVAQLALPALTTTARMRPFDVGEMFFGKGNGGGDDKILSEDGGGRSGDVA